MSLAYPGGDPVLRDVSLALEPGSFHFLTGPSGAGKSSLLRLLYLAMPPTHGRIALFGEDTSLSPRAALVALRRRIGVVFQEFRLINHLSVFDNVALPLRVAGARVEDYADDVRELLVWVGLGERMNALPPTLSGGEQQRVAIARAVVGKPDMILADEPTGNVDPEMGRRLVRLFVEMNRLGATVVIATHDPELVKAVSAPVLALEGGDVVREAAS